MDVNLLLDWRFLTFVVILVLITLVKNELRQLINRIHSISYDKLKIILAQYKAKKEVSASGNMNEVFEKIYEKITGAQIHFLYLLKQFSKKGVGMPCGYASQYFQNLVKSQTNRYDGWITPFFTDYLEGNRLVSVSNNYYHLETLGTKFLDYLEKMGYSEKDKQF